MDPVKAATRPLLNCIFCIGLLIARLEAQSLEPTNKTALKQTAKSGSPSQSAVRLLRSWDANRDRKLDRTEIPPAARAKFQNLAKASKLDLERGIPIDVVLGAGKKIPINKDVASKGHEQDRGVTKKSGGQPAENPSKAKRIGKQDAKSEAGDMANEKATAEQHDSPATSGKRQQSDFGDSRSLDRAAPGFASSAEAADVLPAAEPSTAEPSESRETGEEEKQDSSQLRFLARSLLRQHDLDKSGRLEQNEWQRLRGEPEKSDRDGDGSLTEDELVAHLGGYARREKPPQRVERRRSPRERAKRERTTSHRFLTPHERLPNGLPDWFVEKDLNQDGQIALSEYAKPLTRADLEVFRQLDRNHDGLIVADEYLKATEERESK